MLRSFLTMLYVYGKAQGQGQYQNKSPCEVAV
jgi:hypothetical protein